MIVSSQLQPLTSAQKYTPLTRINIARHPAISIEDEISHFSDREVRQEMGGCVPTINSILKRASVKTDINDAECNHLGEK